jgi:hypothetical protein
MKKLLFAVIFLTASFNVFGQIQEIGSKVFYSAIRVADDKKLEFSRREKMKQVIYSKGRIKEVKEEIDDFLIPDKQRYLLVETIGKKVERLELIKIGDRNYQKKNNRNWTKEEQWNRPEVLSSIPVPLKSLYTLETTTINNQSARLYKFYAVFNEFSPAEEEEEQGYFEDKVWINNDGFVIREEKTMGKPQSKEISSIKVYEYEYNPKDLKIESPIK